MTNRLSELIASFLTKLLGSAYRMPKAIVPVCEMSLLLSTGCYSFNSALQTMHAGSLLGSARKVS